MVSKNNNHLYDEKMNRTHFSFSLRKLNIGVASVLLGIGFGFGVVNHNGTVAHADTTDTTSTTTDATPASDASTSSASATSATTTSVVAVTPTSAATSSSANDASSAADSSSTSSASSDVATNDLDQAISADAIDQGYITSETDLTNAAHTLSGHVYIADYGTYSTMSNGMTDAPDGTKVYMQWMDTDGAISPIYVATTHSNIGTSAGQGGAGLYAFNLSSSSKGNVVKDGWTDANGKVHVYNATAGQYYRLWVVDTKAADGNTLTMFRQAGGFYAGSWVNSFTTSNLGQFPLAGTNMQRTAVFMYELPEGVTNQGDNGVSYMTTSADQWKTYDQGTLSAPAVTGAKTTDGTTSAGLSISGRVWLESTAGNAANSGTGPNYNPAMGDGAASGYTVVASVLTEEGATAYKNSVSSLDNSLQAAAAKELLEAHPEYIAETVKTTTDSNGQYSLAFSSDAITSAANQHEAIYMFVMDKNGNVVTAYSPYTTTLFRSPNATGTSSLSPQIVPAYNAAAFNSPSWYNVNFAVVPNTIVNLDITNYDTTNNPASYGDTANVKLSDYSASGSGQLSALDDSIKWTSSNDSSFSLSVPVSSINDGSLANLTISADGKTVTTADGQSYTFDEAIPEGTVFTASLVEGTVTVAADSFMVKTTDAKKYEPNYADQTVAAGQTASVTPTFTDKEGNTVTLPEGTTFTSSATDANGSSASAWATLDPTTGEIVYTPSADQASGDYEVPVTVTYADGSTDQVTATVHVTNQAADYTPVYDNDGHKYVKAGDSVDFPAPTFTDKDGNTVTVPSGTTFTAGDTSFPGTVTVDPTTGAITATANDGATAGDYTVPVTVTYPDGTSEVVNATVTVVPAPDKVTTTTVPYTTTYTADPTKDAGVQTVVTEGQNGSTTTTTTQNVDPNTGALTDGTSTTSSTPATDAVISVGTKPTTTTETIPYETVKEDDPTLDQGQEVVKTPGQDGTKTTTTTYTVNPTTGELTPTSTTTQTDPVNEVVLVGTKTPADNKTQADTNEPAYADTTVPAGQTATTNPTFTNGTPEGATYSVDNTNAPFVTVDPTTGALTAAPSVDQAPGEYTVPVTVTYSDGSTDTVDAKITVTDNEAATHEAQGGDVTKPYGEATTADDVTNAVKITPDDDVAKNATVTVDDPTTLPDGKTPGTVEVPVTVTYPDGSQDHTTVSVTTKEPGQTVTDAESHDAQGGEVNKPYGEATTAEDVTSQVTITPDDDVAKNATVTVDDPTTLPDGKTPGTVEVPVTVTYPDGSQDHTTVKVTTDTSDADKYEPQGQDQTVNQGDTPKAEDSISNKGDLPDGTKYDWKETPDTNTPGDKTATVVVTYPDGSQDEVPVTIHVTTDADTHDAQGGQLTKPYGQPTTAEDVTSQVTITPDDDVAKNATVTVDDPTTLPDGKTSGTVTIPVTVTYPDGSQDHTTVTVTTEKSQAETNDPQGQDVNTTVGKTPDAADAIKNKGDLPDGTTYTWKETPDVTTTGDKPATVVVTYPDGSQDEVPVTIHVTNPTAECQDITTPKNQVPDASDGIKNKDEMPDGTKYEWKETPDVTKPGQTTGTVVVTYPDGTKTEVPVTITVNGYDPQGQDVNTTVGKTPNAADAIKNKGDLPDGTTYTWKETPDVTTTGDKTATVVVTYPDGTQDEVTVTVHVTNPTPETQDITTPKGQVPDPSAGIKNKDDMPSGTKYEWKETPDVSKTGQTTGTVVVTFPDGTQTEVQVTITITDYQTNTVTTTWNDNDQVLTTTTSTATNASAATTEETKAQLPQTGNDQSEVTTIAGLMAASMVGLLGLAKFRKKENK